MCLVALALLGACSDLRVNEGIYTTLDEAKAAGAIQAGWVPAGLPSSAADLREGHLPDGRHWGVFTFPPRDADAVRALVGDELTSGSVTCAAPGRLEWSQRILQTPIAINWVPSTGFRLYLPRPGQRSAAINWRQGRACYWRG